MAAAVSAKAPGTRQHNSAPRPSPLTHNQPASQPAHLLEDLDQAVAGDGGADLLRAGRDGKGHLGLDARGQGLLGHRGGAHHVLVRGVGAGANQAGCRRGGRGGGGGGAGSRGQGVRVTGPLSAKCYHNYLCSNTSIIHHTCLLPQLLSLDRPTPAHHSCLLTRHLQGPALAARVVRKLGQRVCEVWGEGAVDLGLQVAHVDLNHLVVLSARVSTQVLAAQGGRGGERGQSREEGVGRQGTQAERARAGRAQCRQEGCMDTVHSRAAYSLYAAPRQPDPTPPPTHHAPPHHCTPPTHLNASASLAAGSRPVATR